MESELVFYTNPMSRGRIIRWMLEEVGQPYRTEVLQYGVEMNSAAYLRINPMGKVPCVVHGDQVVTEAAAICLYLADAFPDADLAPALQHRADYYRFMLFAAGPLEQAVICKSFGWSASNPQEEGRLGFGSFDRTIDSLAKHLSGRRYLAGDRFSAADLYVGAHLGWGMGFKLIPELPEFTAYLNPLRERAAYRRAAELDDALIAQAQQQQ